MRGMRALVLGLVVLAGCNKDRSQGAAGDPPQSGAVTHPPPAWAYPLNPQSLAPPADDGGPHSLPNSQASFTSHDLGDLFGAPDWYPNDHPPMPALVAHGATPGVYACGYCHLPNGLGRPENTSLAGLPASYILQQVGDFAKGARKSSVAERVPSSLMVKLSSEVANDPGLDAAAKYFASLAPKSMTQVVEADVVPKTEVDGWVRRKSADGATEPLGERIVEIPDDFARFEERDPRATFTAYVPRGSLARGDTLIRTGASGTTLPCASCHGPDLRGLAYGPPIAGRFPGYLARQLFDIQSGARNGNGAITMKSVVAKLSAADVIAIAARAGSMTP